jgi:subtilisin-like proprotein convertase family protein
LRSRRTWSLLFAAVAVAGLLPLTSGTSAAAPVCNTAPLIITPPAVPTQAVRPADVYPSLLNINGQSGTITDVNVQFKGVTHDFPEDFDVMLVAPNGSTNLIVMSDIGGPNTGTSFPVNGIDLTFDDQAAAFAPTDTQLSTGTFKPTNDNNDPGEFVPGNVDTFPSPAPTPSTATTLSTFNGLSANGNWSLYLVDDEPGPFGTFGFNGGWCLDIQTSGTPTTTSSSSTSTSSTSTSTSSTSTSTSTTTSSSTTTTLPPTTTTSPPPRNVTTTTKA